MARYIKCSDALAICRKWNRACFESNDSKGQWCAETIEDEILDLPTADVVEVGVFQDWLNEIAFNNVGVDGTLVNACIEIISRLDGLRIFARERSDTE